jgi:RNA polymerase sigma factor (TIGR02999 family)
MADRAEHVTRILDRLQAGDGQAAEDLLPVVYEQLKRMARAQMARERGARTLQPTALVHEAWLRLCGGASPDFASRAAFFGAAARAMRRILVERARRVRALRRGGDGQRVTLAGVEPAADAAPTVDLLALDEALRALEAEDPRMAEVVALRYFAGLDVEETAAALGISARTVKREWAVARAFLLDAMGGDGAER